MHYYSRYPLYCRDCGQELELQKRGGPILRCDPCRVLHNAERAEVQRKLYRQRHPERVKASRHARYMRDKAAGKYKSRAERQTEARKRADILVPKIQKELLKPGASFATVAPKFGLTRNAVAGLMHRHRKWEIKQGASK